MVRGYTTTIVEERPKHPQSGAVDPFRWLALSCSGVIIAFILFPLLQMVFQPSLEDLATTIADGDVLRAIWRSVYTALSAAVISLVFGTPFAYLLARRNFIGKRFVESIVDLPIMIPHPVVGIAILSIAGRNHWLGQILQKIGIEVMGTAAGLVGVMTFVGLPFYVNTVKAGFEAVPERLEKVSPSLGASTSQTFFRVTFPLAWRSMIVGMIMCTARAVSEFGAVVIVAYHPMVAPVMIYERFTAYGLKYSQPATPFVADFVGIKNVFPAVFEHNLARVKQSTLKTTAGSGTHRYVAIRPENIRLGHDAGDEGRFNCVHGRVCRMINQGFFTHVDIQASGIRLRTVLTTSTIAAMHIDEGKDIIVKIDPRHVHVI